MIERIRVAFADDHPVVLDGLVRFFDSMPRFQVVGRAVDLDSLHALLSTEKTDVVVLDLDMPGMQGLAGLETSSRRFPDVRWCIFTMQPEDQLASRYVEAGASAFLNKGRSTDELVAAVERAFRGEVQAPVARDTSAMPHATLSPREREVFLLLIAGASTQKVTRTLGIRPSTAHTYVERIKNKLGVDSLADVVAYGFRHRLID